MALSDYASPSPPHRFDGRAGTLQDEADAAGLTAELGRNYDTYHRQLAAAFTKLGGLPDRSEFMNGKRFDVVGYTERGGHFDRLIHAEAFLRWCTGKISSKNLSTGDFGPLVTADMKLTAMATGTQAKDATKEPAPVPMPDWAAENGRR